MIKPIIYRNIEEKEALERKLMSGIPYEERLAKSKALMDVFASHVKKANPVKLETKINNKC